MHGHLGLPRQHRVRSMQMANVSARRCEEMQEGEGSCRAGLTP